jgi:hypothetical protein
MPDIPELSGVIFHDQAKHRRPEGKSVCAAKEVDR